MQDIFYLWAVLNIASCVIISVCGNSCGDSTIRDCFSDLFYMSVNKDSMVADYLYVEGDLRLLESKVYLSISWLRIGNRGILFVLFQNVIVHVDKEDKIVWKYAIGPCFWPIASVSRIEGFGVTCSFQSWFLGFKSSLGKDSYFGWTYGRK